MHRQKFGYKRFCSRRAAVVTAAALALTCGTAAFGQPMGGPGGHMGPGPGGAGFLDAHFGQMLESAKTRLALDTSQQGLWDNAVAASKAARESGRAIHQKARDAARAELAKAEPDLAALATMTDDVHAQAQALRRGVRDQWLKLYATFNPQQKAVVRELMQQRMDRADQFRQRMRERLGSG